MDLQAIAYILRYGHIREESIRLKDHSYVPLVWSLIGDNNIVNGDITRCGSFKSRDHSQGGRFPAARGTQERDELALLNL